ncbi:calsyntenin-1-like [Ornithodoros turicata]|uniref:calsyntenin-1-like n=1 Tax=Ornithodoros turicata TaxID=34597 RepID=UPI003139335D
MKYLSTLVLLALGVAASPKAPRLEDVNTDVGYHALVKENSRHVEIMPRIRVVDAKVCRFLITHKKHGEAPFEVRVTDEAAGEAELYAKKDLNCEKHRNYKFDIAAVGCNGLVSENVTVHLTVEDVNEFAPQFAEESYQGSVNEGELPGKHVLQVHAHDADCTPKNSEICKYDILDPHVPFSIDSEGTIHTTETLSWESSSNHIFRVVAFDCSMKQSHPVTITVKVNRICHVGWKGIEERVEYNPGSQKRALFPEAQLELCSGTCDPDRLTARLTLAAGHVGKGCDRDTYSVDSQRKICGASSDSVDLLPSPGVGAEWTQGLHTDEGRESDQVYEFDGATNAVVIPESTVSHNLTDSFTLAFWMRHKAPTGQNATHMKEHVLCSSDDHRMSRHHLSLFVRHCRLILLLRREPSQEQPNKFTPAEWRWKSPEVCDDRWHHYAVSVNFPEASLFVDGQPFRTSANNPEVVDDWPLHRTKGVNTTLVVGACWQGKENRMAFHFHGYLAGLSVLRGRTESPDVLACLHRCKEWLEGPSADSQAAGTEVVTNSEKNEVTLNARDQDTLEDMVSRVSYVNARDFPTPGRRTIRITTTIECTNGQSQKVPAEESWVVVLPAEQPSISINGTPNLAREYEPFKQGIELFASVSITVGRPQSPSSSSWEEESSEDDDDSEETNHVTPVQTREPKLDSCSVQVYPPLNPDHERFQLPSYLMAHLGLHHREGRDGLVIYGSDRARHYESVLRQILYFNKKPAYYLNRAFKLVCSELNGRFVSNEYIQTLTVIHPRAEAGHHEASSSTPVSGEKTTTAAAVSAHRTVAQAHVQVAAHSVDVKEAKVRAGKYVDVGLLDGSASEALAKTSASHAVTIIIVVCVGFLVFMIVLGVIRIRAAHHHTQRHHRVATDSREDDQEMAWDDSSLTITVNPMDQIAEEQEGRRTTSTSAARRSANTAPADEEDSDSSDDGSSYHDESEEEEAAPDKAKTKGDLEWDDSTLNF